MSKFKTDKVIRDGKVAVLVSPGYGAGWSTWSKNPDVATFSPEVVEWVESGKPTLSEDEEAEWGDRFGYLGGLNDLEIEWLPEGTRFQITEYDGHESLEVLSPDGGYTA